MFRYFMITMPVKDPAISKPVRITFHLFCFFSVVLYLCHATAEQNPRAAFANSFSAYYRPSLYLNGYALGEQLTAWLSTQYLSTQSLEPLIPIPLSSLRYGKSILFSPNSKEYRDLDSWLSGQSESSVTPLEFYKKCFEISSFETQRALILAWDFLSHGWENALERNNFSSSRALFDITGEHAAFDGQFHYRPVLTDDGNLKFSNDGIPQLELIVVKRGDLRGAWYHFAGTALAGFSYPDPSRLTGTSWFTYLLIEAERRIHGKSSGIDNKKRLQIDRAGADFGVSLLKLGNSVSKYRDQPVFSDRKDLYDVHYSLAEGQRSWFWRLKIEPGFFKSPDYLKALLWRSTEDRLAMNPVRIFLSSEGELILETLQRYSESDRNDPVLDQLLSKSIMTRESIGMSSNDLSISFRGLSFNSQSKVREGMLRYNELAIKSLGRHGYPGVERIRHLYSQVLKSDDVLVINQKIKLDCITLFLELTRQLAR